MYSMLALYVFLLQSCMLHYENKDPMILSLELFVWRFRYPFYLEVKGTVQRMLCRISLCAVWTADITFFCWAGIESSFLIILKWLLNVSFTTQNQEFLWVIKELLQFWQIIKSKWRSHYWNSHKSLQGSRELHCISGARAARGNDWVFP